MSRVNLIYALAALAVHEGSDRQAQLEAMEYTDYLLTPEWVAIRRRKLNEAGHQCAGCGLTGLRMDIHHLCYPRRGTETNKDLQVRCRKCHGEVHGIMELEL